MRLKFAAVLPIIFVMIGCTSDEMPVCEVFVPPESETNADEMTPIEVVKQSTWEVRAKLQCNKAFYADNPDQLHRDIDEILETRFNRQFMAMAVLARHWRDATDEQRQRFTNALSREFTRRYSEWMLESDLENLEVLPFDGDITKNTTIVKTRMPTTLFGDWSDSDAIVAVDYGLANRETGWLVFDVTIEGVSYVRNFRKEVDSEIRATSLDDSIERLEAATSTSKTE